MNGKQAKALKRQASEASRKYGVDPKVRYKQLKSRYKS